MTDRTTQWSMATATTSDRMMLGLIGGRNRCVEWKDRLQRELRRAWSDRRDETGLDEAVTKMIWLAVGIVVALAATAFFVSTFNQAKDSVPDPVAP
ncbi:MAG: hypothetical protein ACKO27_00005 [Ilumatobacteraceae bacterium]